MRIAETIAALCVTLLGVVTIYLARQLPYDSEYGPGAGFLPFWLGVVLVILSVFLLRDALQAGAAAASSDGGGAASEGFFAFAPGASVPWLIFFLCTIAISVLFERLGFGLAIGLYMLVTMRWVARQSWPWTIILAIVTPIVLYVGFVRLLMVPLPLAPPGF